MSQEKMMPGKINSRPTRPLRYHLRFQVLPGRSVESDARDLAGFCKKHGVEEVVLFFAAEEWNDGLLSQADEDVWFDAVARAKKVLDRAGIVVSLNPWTTALCTSRGRGFPPGRTFEPTVSPTGQASTASASFNDPAWQEYWYKLIGRFARLGFRVLWIEDDFRYHNHRPLTWGGGFEPSIIRRFSERIGRPVTREEVVKNILQPGEPHPWRALWQELWRDIQLEVARGTAKAIDDNSPSPSALGLMSSQPTVHSAEGRDWSKLFDAMRTRGGIAHRPHVVPYGEAPGRNLAMSIMLMDIQNHLRPADCEVAPEIENIPFTRWNKSDTMTWAHMALTELFAPDALLLDVFPQAGNRASDDPEIGELLDLSRPSLKWLAARFGRGMETCGVGLPWRQDAQQHVRLDRGKGMDEMNASPYGPGNFLLPYGVSVSAARQSVNAVFGSMAWAYDDEQVQSMLAGGLLLDSTAADILTQRGFGKLVGAKVDAFVGREDSTYSIETVVARGLGVRPGLYMNINEMPSLARMEPAKGAAEWTTVITPQKKRFGAGVVAYRNALGGRVVTYAAAAAATPRLYQRQAIARAAVTFLAGGKFDGTIVSGSPYCMPIHFRQDGRPCVVAFNGSADIAQPAIFVPGVTGRPTEATLLAPLAKPAKASLAISRSRGGLNVACRSAIPHLGLLVLDWR